MPDTLKDIVATATKDSVQIRDSLIAWMDQLDDAGQEV